MLLLDEFLDYAVELIDGVLMYLIFLAQTLYLFEKALLVEFFEGVGDA